MNLPYTTELHERYLRLTVTGAWDLIETLKMIEVVRAECESAGRDRALVDLRALRGTLSDAERLWAGKQAALALGPDLRLALLDHAERINAVAERAAVQRGAQLYVCASEADALAWLLET
jgi:hypothetical protein